MKVIFLDIDGVLNTAIYATHYFEICKHFGMTKNEAKYQRHGMRDQFGSHFDPRPVTLLKWIIEQTGAKIVVSSTWRHSGLETMKLMWEMRDLPGEVIDITPHFNTDRGEEIAEWLRLNEVESYVIIDDDKDMLAEQLDNFVKTDGEYGITYKDCVRAIEILNRVS